MSTDKRPHLQIRETLPEPRDRIYKGGGGGTYPRTSYQEHANKIFKEASELKNKIDAQVLTNSKDEKVYFRAELPIDFKAALSEGKTLEEKTFSKIVGSPTQNIAHLVTTKEQFTTLVEQLERYSSTEESVGKSNFATIDGISPIPLSEKVAENLQEKLRTATEPIEILVSLFPDLTSEEKRNYKRHIDSFLKQNKGELLNEYDALIGMILRVKADRETLLKLADKFMAIQNLNGEGELVISASSPGQNLNDNIIVLPNSSNAKACIFDSGVDTNLRFISGSLIGSETPLGQPYNIDHGTFVASRIIYGDSILEQITKGTLAPDVKVLSICMRPHDGIGNVIKLKTEKFMEVVRTTVEQWHRQIRVYNISMNFGSPAGGDHSCIKDDVINPLSAELDKLTQKYDVLFVVSTGNYPAEQETEPTQPFPEYFNNQATRLWPPAEANLALTVGSVASKHAPGTISGFLHPSPFTRRGPGFGKYKKPDLVAHGGNLATGWTRINDYSSVGFGSHGNQLAYNNGTSFSAPLVTRLAAKIFELMPNANSAQVRAMLIHFADRPEFQLVDGQRASELYGHGIPNTESIIASSKWEQSFLFHGSIQDRKIQRIPFRVPEVLVNRKGRKILGVRVTVALNGETDITLKSAYCKSRLRTNIYKLGEQNVQRKVSREKDDIEIVNDDYAAIIKRENQFSRGIVAGDWILELEHISRWELKEDSVKYGVVM